MSSMSGNQKKITRRNFLKNTAAAGFGSTLVPLHGLKSAHASSSSIVPEHMIMQKRPFGKTGVDVSILSLGGVLKSTDLLIFRQALKRGVTY